MNHRGRMTYSNKTSIFLAFTFLKVKLNLNRKVDLTPIAGRTVMCINNKA
jgi:hypothetical protein